MRVALDAGPLLNAPTGVGRYTRELGIALEGIGVDVRRFAFAWRGQAPAGVRRVKIPTRAAWSLWRRFGWPTAEGLVGGADVVHGTNFVLPASRRRGVVTIHDLSYLQADAFPGAERLKELVPWSIKRAGAVVVPTEAIAAEVVDTYSVDRQTVHVTYEGVSPVFFGATPLSDVALAGMGVSRPFVLATGTDAPRKNLQRLLDAWGATEAGAKGWTLVLAGPSGWGPRLRRTEDIHPLGWVGDETLPGLMAAADIFCYPSLYEGFGLPPLEAMAAGTACLVGRYSAAPEVLGDAALVVDPTDADAIGEALTRLLADADLRKTLAIKGRGQATRYTWANTAKATAEAYQAAMK
ncbi:MAG TPA: glycosyltransferase family 1 protein [Actinomycetota bacterium]|nr:glycosyltransferase family 1 protein [Actinomycetota bacterium]